MADVSLVVASGPESMLVSGAVVSVSATLQPKLSEASMTSSPSRTWTVTAWLPAASKVMVPLMSPVVASIARPAGRPLAP